MPESQPQPRQSKPAAMIRGTRPLWGLFDRPGPEYPGQFTEPAPLVTFYGEYSAARKQAEEWCDNHDFYLSGYSDADDRPAEDTHAGS